jgi:enterochelin esterase-like enzyme
MGFKARGPARWLAAGAGLVVTSVTFAAADSRAARAQGSGEASAAATLVAHAAVRGEGAPAVDLRPAGGHWESVPWGELSSHALDPGAYELRLRVDGSGLAPLGASLGEALEVPVCAGRGRIMLDGAPVRAPPGDGPVVVPLGPGSHELRVAITVSRYERRVACGDPVRVGRREVTRDGLALLAFESPHAARGGGRAVLYVPPGHEVHRAAPLLVGAHPWNGSIWTYAAYGELLAEARARDVVLLMPSGLGNSLYTADAEDEVLRAVDAAGQVVAIDRAAVSLWGASMGGAGATTIGLHHPDRFASVTSFFGDSKYDLATYVRAILPTEAAAHRVNALDVADNARNVPVWLVHGEDDAVSPIRQSERLAAALSERGFHVRFDRAAGTGHAGSLVASFAARVVDVAAEARVPAVVARVTYRSVRPQDTGAYGVRFTRASARGDAYVDVERTADAVHVRAHEGVTGVVLARGALGVDAAWPPPLFIDDRAPLDVTWAP